MDPIISPGQIQPEIPQNSKFSFLKSAKVWPFIVLLALLIPAGTYFLGKSQTNNQTPTIQTSPTPTSDPTANWKIYSGAGFSFKYPPTFYVEKNESGADYISDSKSSLDTWRSSIYGGKLQDSQLVINVLELNENFKGKIPGSMIYRMLGEPTTVPSTIFNIEGSQGVKVIYKNEEHYGIAFQDKFIWISAKPASSNLIKTFETMMSAFKLTDPTANWKTYTDTKYGFSFKYPENFSIHSFTSEGPYLALYPGAFDPFRTDYQRMTIEPTNSIYSPDSSKLSEKILVGNIEGLLIKDFGCPGSTNCEGVIVNVNGKSYIIRLTKDTYEKGISESLFQQILSTFKFTQ